tara:strand:- start:650 stop:1450 length:801 start_codon:yes stop_codon:yes gene_type:complete
MNNRPNEKFDLGIVIIPKNNPNINIDSFRTSCDKVAVMQEGPHWYFQDYTVDKQFHYYNTLMEADWIYCHNYSDIKYYQGLGCKDIRVMRSLMIPEGLHPRSESGNSTLIGGNFVSWYGGFDSYIIAREIGDPIYAPSMGRKQEQESMIEDINYLPYMSWREWIDNLSQYNIGIHLMRTHAAGTFAMNCAFHGIPCIGYRGLDTQELLHSNTMVEVGDLQEAKKIAIRLRDDIDFYDECSDIAKRGFQKYYTEKSWLENWNEKNKI